MKEPLLAALLAASVVVLLAATARAQSALARDIPGDEDFARAFDAALMEAIQSREIDDILTRNQILLSGRVMDCLPSPSGSGYPKRRNGTVISDILARGYVLLGTRAIDEGSRGNYNVNPPTGASPEIEKALVRLIGKHYNVDPLAVRYKWFDTPQNVMDALSNWTIDATTAMISIGGFVKNSRRRIDTWRPSCAVFSDDVSVMLLNSSGIGSFSELLEVVSHTPDPFIGSVGLSNYQLMQQVFVDATIKPYESDGQALQALKDGAILAFTGNPEAIPNEGLTLISTGVVLPRAAWFRKEVPVEYKVLNAAALPYWKTGNDQLARAFEAALNAMSQQDVTNKILARYNVTTIEVADCFTSSSAYRLPSDPEGTYKRVIDSHTLRIGFHVGDFRPLYMSNGTSRFGALFELERKVVAWMSKLLGTTEIDPVWVPFSSSEEVMTALLNGDIDVTSSFFASGLYYRDTTRRLIFRTSCTSNAFSMNITVNAENRIYSTSELQRYIASHRDMKLGAVSDDVQQLLHYIYPGITIVKFGSNAEALDAVLKGHVIAVMTTWVNVKELDSRFVRFPSGHIFSQGALFRRDNVTSCGDGIVDAELGEQCELGKYGCDENCTCAFGFKPTKPVSAKCQKINLAVWKILSIAAAVFIIVVIAVLLIALVFIPCMRKRYMQLGAARMRHSMIYRRYPERQHSSASIQDQLSSPLAPARQDM